MTTPQKKKLYLWMLLIDTILYGTMIWFFDFHLVYVNVKEPMEPKFVLTGIIIFGYLLSSITCCILPYGKLLKNDTKKS